MVDNRNKRIAKNSLLLYFRMLITMALSLYTSRVVLQTLGVEDFGIYNAVGGVVALFSALSGSFSTMVARFITIEIGKGDFIQLKRVFSASVIVQNVFAILAFVVIVGLGIWFVNNKMNIPEPRLSAANYVLLFSAITFAVHLTTIPYNALIIAHEKMSIFAIISIFEAILKLAIAFAIFFSPIDFLKTYAILMCFSSILVRFVYWFVCRIKFPIIHFAPLFDRALFKQMFTFSGWNMIGASSAVFRDHGSNIILNLFCGPVTNAARGIAVQVGSAVSQFASNFTTAVNPQITKSYATCSFDYMNTLIIQSAKFSFFLLLLISIPIALNIDFILKIWLVQSPEYSSLFIILTIIFILSESISAPLITAMLATGNIRNYQIIVGGLQMMNLPLDYMLLKKGCNPASIYIVAILVSQICLFSRLFLLRNMIQLQMKKYIQNVYFKVILVSFFASLPPFYLKCKMESEMSTLIVTSLVSLCSSFIVILFLGCNNQERSFAYSMIRKIVFRGKNDKE